MEYSYFNDTRLPIKVTSETVEVTPFTFKPNKTVWEMASIHKFFSQIDPEGEFNIADVGAQSGSYTLLAKYLPKSSFYSFEPFKKSYKCLVDNIELNGLKNVQTFDVALSNISGSSVLNTCAAHNGMHTLSETPMRFKDVVPVEIQTRTLDEFFYDVDRPLHFMKIDTEGWEFRVLEGGRKTLEKYRPVIQLEWVPVNMHQCGVNERDLSELLQTYGYREVSKIGEEKIFRSDDLTRGDA
jgi:FkbM family methyltransferase